MGKKKKAGDFYDIPIIQRVEDIIPKKDDPISPNHYSAGMPEGIQVKDILKAQGLWEAACRSNLIKYVLRAEFKNGLEDYKKAAQYLEWLIEEKEKNA